MLAQTSEAMNPMFSRYLSIIGLGLLAFLLNWVAPVLLNHFASLAGTEAALARTLWCLSLFLGFGWACSRLAENTVFPSFTLQLLVGVLLHDALAPLASELRLSVVVCTALAAIILKSGGDEVERKSIARIAFPTLMIAIPGFLLTFLVMYLILSLLGVDGLTSALLAAIISSTDPAALIPTLKSLVFKHEHRHLNALAVAESAVNDAVGAIVTLSLTAMVIAGTSMDSAGSLLHSLMEGRNLQLLGQQLLFGIVAGLCGGALMHAYEWQKSRQHSGQTPEASYDFAFVIAVPLATFLIAKGIHGNGFLAAFVAGLVDNYNHAADKFHKTLHAMEIKVESIAKPVIFMMVGPFVAIADLARTFWLGLLAALCFILIARPVAVFISLLPTRITTHEKWFLCATRETGVIPVVLAVLTSAQFPQLSLLMPLTAWMVIWTLGVLPALTPWWAGKLGLLEK
jgi:NhaP-type Na+/H+ or K+/H+ antiporter